MSLIDFDSNLKAMSNFTQHFTLDPNRWASFDPQPPLEWKSVRFTAASTTEIPEAKGIYTFVIQFQDHSAPPTRLPMHGYVVYRGSTPRGGTLRSRFTNYLDEQKRAKRLTLWSTLNKWTSSLFFHYAIVDPSVDLLALEIALNDAIVPPKVTNDFSAGTRAVVRVFRSM